MLILMTRLFTGIWAVLNHAPSELTPWWSSLLNVLIVTTTRNSTAPSTIVTGDLPFPRAADSHGDSIGTIRNILIRLGRCLNSTCNVCRPYRELGLQSSVVAIINVTHCSNISAVHTIRHCNTHASIQSRLSGMIIGNGMSSEVSCSGWPWQDRTYVVG